MSIASFLRLSRFLERFPMAGASSGGENGTGCGADSLLFAQSFCLGDLNRIALAFTPFSP
jgi:hypothetical protein